MKLTKKLLSTMKIYNTYDYAKKQHPFIWHRNRGVGRDMTIAAWMIHWPGHKFDTHWTDYGDLSFSKFGRSKQESLEDAIVKFKELFGAEEVAKTPFGSYMDKKFVEERNRELVELLKGAKDENR